MISYAYLPMLVLSAFLIISIRRFWICANSMGFMRELSQRAPTLLQRDIMAAVLALVPVSMALIDWFGITLPRQSEPMPPLLGVILAAGSLGASVAVLHNTLDRLAGSWAGTRESVLRTIAALQIIDSTELGYSAHAHVNHHTKSIHAERSLNVIQSKDEK
jgi:hypothetical protein